MTDPLPKLSEHDRWWLKWFGEDDPHNSALRGACRAALALDDAVRGMPDSDLEQIADAAQRLVELSFPQRDVRLDDVDAALDALAKLTSKRTRTTAIAHSQGVPPSSSPPAEAARPNIDERMRLQSAEFAALNALIKRFNALPAVVDDDYPECRHYYEGALKSFLDACAANGRRA